MSRGPSNNNGPAEVGVWAKEKLQALARYLDFYTTVLKNQSWCRTIYFDGFAGGGRSAIRRDQKSNEPLALFDSDRSIEAEERELIDGSPRIALGIQNQFNRYVFVDPDPVRTAELRELQEEHGEKVVVLDCTATEGVDWLLEQNIKKSSHRGVAFLDPFGAKLDWESVENLAKTGLFEVIINFALDMGIVRVLTNSAEMPEAWISRLDRYFGGHEWFDHVYHRPDELFGAGELQKRADYRERLLQMYRCKLKEAFGHVSSPRLIRNTRGAPLYYLLWAGPHKKGLDGAEHILKMGERLSSPR